MSDLISVKERRVAWKPVFICFLYLDFDYVHLETPTLTVSKERHI